MRFVGVISLCALLSACAILDVSDDVSYGYQSQRIPADLLRQIVPEKTTEAWVIENLGRPTSKSELADGGWRLSYRFEELRTRRVRFFLLFRYRSSDVIPRHVHIDLLDGVVVKLDKDYQLSGEGGLEPLGN